jgi:hypothetical protein
MGTVAILILLIMASPAILHFAAILVAAIGEWLGGHR